MKDSLAYNLWFSLISLGFFFLLLFLAWKKKWIRSFSLPKKEEISLLVSWKQALEAFLLFFAIQMIFTPLILTFFLQALKWIEGKNLHFSKNFIEGWGHFFASFFSLFFLFLYFFSLPSEIKKSIETRGKENKSSFWRSWLKGVGFWILVYPFVLSIHHLTIFIVQWLRPHEPVKQNALESLQSIEVYPLLFVLSILSICFLVPILEEFLFRGFLQTFFHRLIGTWKAIFLTSLIFSFFHFSFSQGLENIELLISIFILSCALGYLFEKEKSIWVPIGLHSIFNSFAALVIVLN